MLRHLDNQGFQTDHKCRLHRCLKCKSRHNSQQTGRIHMNRPWCWHPDRSCMQKGPNIPTQCKNSCRCRPLPHCRSCLLRGRCNREFQMGHRSRHRRHPPNNCHRNRNLNLQTCNLRRRAQQWDHNCTQSDSSRPRMWCSRMTRRRCWRQRRSCRQWKRCIRGRCIRRRLAWPSRRNCQLRDPNSHSKIRNQSMSQKWWLQGRNHTRKGSCNQHTTRIHRSHLRTVPQGCSCTHWQCCNPTPSTTSIRSCRRQ